MRQTAEKAMNTIWKSSETSNKLLAAYHMKERAAYRMKERGESDLSTFLHAICGK